MFWHYNRRRTNPAPVLLLALEPPLKLHRRWANYLVAHRGGVCRRLSVTAIDR
jgi:hypothetical protein